MKALDLLGQKFGRLTVISKGEDYINPDGRHVARWNCKCDCGNPNTILIRGTLLNNGHTKSCGCLRKEQCHDIGSKNTGVHNQYCKLENIYDLNGSYGIGYTKKGEEFYFDLEDYELIKPYCWHIDSNGYVVARSINIDNKIILMHRLVMGLKQDDKYRVDHIFHHNNDNRKDKLRLVTGSQNLMNSKLLKNNTSGEKGVIYDKDRDCWRAFININGSCIYGGRFKDFEMANKARKELEYKYFKQYNYQYYKEDNMDLNNIFGKIAHGMCRLDMNGRIAVKTTNGYKTYDLKKNKLVNCANFVFDIGEEFFFVIPTNRIKKGDILLISGKPKCVIDFDDKSVKVVNYEDSTIEIVIPERHIFMGNFYIYRKIVSMFGNSINTKSKNGLGNIMKYMMMSEMMKGNSSGGSMNMMGNMLPMMMLSGGSFENMFDGMFDFDMDISLDDDAEDDQVEEDTEAEEENK